MAAQLRAVAQRDHPRRAVCPYAGHRLGSDDLGLELLGLGDGAPRQIRSAEPGRKSVLMSGYSGAQLHERAGAVGIREVLRKPLQSRDIAECLGRVFITAETPAERREIRARP